MILLYWNAEWGTVCIQVICQQSRDINTIWKTQIKTVYSILKRASICISGKTVIWILLDRNKLTVYCFCSYEIF